MWPWGHAAAGYLLYSIAVRALGRRPTDTALLALAVGTQFPDLVDKPLAWSLGVLPGGRTLAHSLLTFAVLAVAVHYATRRYGGRQAGGAFLFGTFVHVLTDGVYSAVALQFTDLTYLFWPVLPMPAYETEQSFLAHFAKLSLTSTVTIEFVLVGLAAALWWADGRPGLTLLRATGRRWLARLGAIEP